MNLKNKTVDVPMEKYLNIVGKLAIANEIIKQKDKELKYWKDETMEARTVMSELQKEKAFKD